MSRPSNHRRQIGTFVIAFGVVSGVSLLHWATTPPEHVSFHKVVGGIEFASVAPAVHWLTAGPVLMVIFAVGFLLRIQAIRAARLNAFKTAVTVEPTRR